MDFLGEGERVMHVMQLAAGMKPGRVVVLPETILPLQSKENTFTASMLADISNQLRVKGSTILAGIEIQEPGQDLQNALVVLGAGSNAALVQRVPVPIGMWQPWQPHTFAVDLLGSGIGQVADRKVAYSICYEQLLVFPVLLSMIHSPDLIVGAANDWWARGTSIPAIQNLALDAWGRLFSVPIIRAANI
jgi:apolipoprotein N-acyltransferase